MLSKRETDLMRNGPTDRSIENYGNISGLRYGRGEVAGSLVHGQVPVGDWVCHGITLKNFM